MLYLATFLLLLKIYFISRININNPVKYLYVHYLYKVDKNPIFYYLIFFDILILTIFLLNTEFLIMSWSFLIASTFFLINNAFLYFKIIKYPENLTTIETFYKFNLNNIKEDYKLTDKELETIVFHSFNNNNFFYIWVNEIYSIFFISYLFIVY